MYICICMYSRVEQILQKWRRVEWESHVRSSSHRYFDGYAEHVENYLFLITDILNIFSDQAPLIIVSRLLLGEKECSYIYIYFLLYASLFLSFSFFFSSNYKYRSKSSNLQINDCDFEGVENQFQYRGIRLFGRYSA